MGLLKHPLFLFFIEPSILIWERRKTESLASNQQLANGWKKTHEEKGMNRTTRTGGFPQNYLLNSRKLTEQCEIDHLKMYLLLKWSFFMAKSWLTRGYLFEH